MKTLTKLLLGLSLIAFAPACSSTQAENPNRVPAHLKGLNFPAWVLKGSGASGKEQEKVFVGVGSVTGVRNHSLARTAAENRARSEVAKVLEVYSASMMKDYMASTTAGDMSASSEEQHIESTIKTVAKETMAGVQIVDHWYHPDGTVYARAELDLNSFTNNLDKMKELNTKVRDYVRKNAERSFMDLESEEAKH